MMPCPSSPSTGALNAYHKGEQQDLLLARLNGQLTEITAYLKILTEVATLDEGFGSSG
jgi:hypothetical protein